MDKNEVNLQRAGEYFMYSLWIQNQMVDLIILKNNPKIISNFSENLQQVPNKMFLERTKYWEKNFGKIKKEFIDLFQNFLEEQDINDLEAIYHIRNAIAHSSISLGRDYLLYKPSRGIKKEENLIKSLQIGSRDDASNPRIFKLTFSNDTQYLNDFNRIKRLDEICFKKLVNEIKISHSRIR